MACVETALIVGGGIAGLSAAIALGRRGVQCDVLETAIEPLGASLGLSGRATDALAELGVYDECYATGRPMGEDSTAGTLHDAAGRVLSAGRERPNWPGARSNVAVYRPVFLQILENAAEAAGAKIRRGLTVQTIDKADGKAAVGLTDGGNRQFDLVIGADGIGSRTRALVFPDAPKPAYVGQLSVRWMVPGPPVQDEGWYHGPLGRVGFYYLPHQQLVYVPAVLPMPEWRRMSDKELASIFTRLLDSYTAPAMLELRRRLTPDANLIGRPFEWILVPDSWYRGRTILIGDAAHATTAHMGQGGGMAIEDAVVLGQCIGAASTVSEALNAFMARRFKRVKMMVEASVTLSRLEREKASPTERADVLTSALRTLGEPY